MSGLSRIANSALCMVVLLAAAPWSHAGIITLFSGDGEIGEIDPNHVWSGDGGVTFHPAYIAAAHGSFDVIAGTKWISRQANLYVPSNASTLFQTTFVLPAGFTEPSLTVSVHADNVATVYINGYRIGQQPMQEIYANFQDPAEQFTTTHDTHFVEGENTLTIDVYNFRLESGVDYLATVSFTPEPATVGLLALGSLVLACGRVRRPH